MLLSAFKTGWSRENHIDIAGNSIIHTCNISTSLTCFDSWSSPIERKYNWVVRSGMLLYHFPSISRRSHNLSFLAATEGDYGESWYWGISSCFTRGGRRAWRVIYTCTALRLSRKNLYHKKSTSRPFNPSSCQYKSGRNATLGIPSKPGPYTLVETSKT